MFRSSYIIWGDIVVGVAVSCTNNDIVTLRPSNLCSLSWSSSIKYLLRSLQCSSTVIDRRVTILSVHWMHISLRCFSIVLFGNSISYRYVEYSIYIHFDTLRYRDLRMFLIPICGLIALTDPVQAALEQRGGQQRMAIHSGSSEICGATDLLGQTQGDSRKHDIHLVPVSRTSTWVHHSVHSHSYRIPRFLWTRRGQPVFTGTRQWLGLYMLVYDVFVD